ncbi:MAG: tetratricopeptide repeat protein [Deltaproteobacteria bacterium]|nr:tetratricopeptide repeat protein [Deltaproteobacteria bacterium]
MDVSQLSQLEACSDWRALAEALEKAAAESQDDAAKAKYLLRLGRVLTDKLLLGAKALRHFQTAWKLQPSSPEPLREARRIYWELGKFSMVETVLRRGLESAADGAGKAEILAELGDVCCDKGAFDEAKEHYRQAAALGGAAAEGAAACLSDLELEADAAALRLSELVRDAEQADSATGKGALLLRAARLAKRAAAGKYDDLLVRAYRANCESAQAAALYEERMVEAGKLGAVLQTQREMIESASAEAGPRLALRCGVRWVVRHQNHDLGARLIEQSLLADPANDVAFTYLREQWGREGGNWDRVLGLVDRTLGAIGAGPAPGFLLAQAGLICWRELGDAVRARQWFERLAAVAQDHPQLGAFEAEHGACRAPAVATADAAPAPDAAPEALAVLEDAADEIELVDDVSVVEEEAPKPPPAPARAAAAPVAAPSPAAPEAHAPEEVAALAPAAPTEVAEAGPEPEAATPEAAPPAPTPAPAAAAEPPASDTAAAATVQDDALIADLKQKAEQFEKARRNHDYVKTLVQIAEAYVDPGEKVAFYGKAAEIYQKFANAAECAKCYEAVLRIDSAHADAAAFLRGYYEKRRDWESLLDLLRREADAIGEAEARAAKYVEMAQLASEKIKKPPLCIELWSKVRELVPTHAEALNQLGMFYERAREWDKLGQILTEQVEITADERERLKMLEKLAQLQGDRLNNDEAAAAAWKQVLELSPDDRRAQEALKKKLLALGRWDDLQQLYEGTDKWDEFIRLLEAQESREKEAPTRIGLLLKIAELWVTKKEKSDRAARAYEKILTIDADHLAAAEALIPIYEEANNPKGLATAIEVKLKSVGEQEGALPLLRQAGELYETRLRKPDLAFERFVAALGLAPTEEKSAEDAERLAAATDGWDKLAAAYRSAIGKVTEPQSEAALRLRLGRVLLDQSKLVDEAIEQYRAVYELEPDNAAALPALDRLYRQTGRFADLLQIYEKQRELCADADALRGVLYAMAELHEKELGSPPSAITTYAQVLDVDPLDARALEALDRLYLAQQDFVSYAGVLRKRLETDVDETKLIDLKYRLGRTLEEHLGDAPGALESYREILFVSPNDERARAALEGLLGHADLGVEAARILAEIYEGREQWAELVKVLEILVGAEPDVAARVGLLRKIAATAAERLTDLGRAFDAQARALRDQPESAEVRLELEELGERAGAGEKLAQVYAEIAGAATDAGLGREYWMRLGAIQEQLGRVDDAAASYGRVLDIEPGDGAALGALEELFTQSERWSDLAGVTRRRIDLCEDGTSREQLFARMAAVYDEKLGKPEEAVAAYCEVLAFDESSLVALRALDGLYSRLGKHAELGENLSAQLALAEDEQAQIGLMLRLGALQEASLGQVEAAIETYRQVLERAPANEAALAALEKLGRTPEHEVLIADILEPLYRSAGDYPKLLVVYEVQVRTSSDSGRKVELLHEMAGIQEDAAGNLGAAFDTMARALEVDPAAEPTQSALARLARATERFADLAKVYETLGAAQQDVELAIRLLTTSATTYETELGNIDAAVGHYRRIMELDEGHLPAAEALERIFRGADRYEELSQILQRKARMLQDLDAQKAALFQAASIEEEVLERGEAAVAVYQQVMELDAEAVPALDALIKLYLGMQKWDRLLETYNKKVELVFEADERKRIYYQMGAVYERELRQVRAAIETYARVLELDPDDLEALGRLDVLYQQAEDWPALLDVLQREANLAADQSESASYQYRIAELYEKRLDDVTRAVELYRELLAQQADHQPTLQALEALTAGEREAVAAALVLEPIYDATDEWAKLIRVLEVQGKAAAEPYQRIELLHRIARLYEDMLSDPASAFATYARAVDADPSHEESLAHYERLAGTVDRWAELAALYDAQLAKLAVEDPARFSELGLRLARIYEEQVEDLQSAIARYERVLEVDAENAAAIAALDRLFEQTERWADLARILAREAEIAQASDEITLFKFRLAQVEQHRLGDVGAAIGSYGEVLADVAGHEGAMGALEGLFAAGTEQLRIAAILEPLYEGSGDFEKLAGVYEAVLGHTTEPEARLQQYGRLAELHEEKLLNPPGALGVHARALRELPAAERALEEIERLAPQADDGWETVANAYADVLGAHADKDVQKLIGKRLARVFEDELGDVTKAEETFNYVLGVAPLDVECLENLDRIHSAIGQYPQLALVLEQRLQTTEETFQLVELCGRLGEIYEQQLGQTGDAIRIYLKIFQEIEPTSEPAAQALERLYAHKQAWAELLGVYERQLQNAVGDAEQSDILAKMGRLLSGYLQQSGRAIETWKRVLEKRGEDGEALGELAALYEQGAKWAELTEVLERHMMLAMGDQEQVAVLHRRARLFTQQLGRDDQALEDYSRILDIDYGNVEALYAINDIHRRRGATQELTYALHQTLDRAGSNLPAEYQVALYRELATIYQAGPEQAHDAIECWRKLLEIDPRDFDAMAALEHLLRAEERWGEVVGVKVTRARAYAEPAEQVREYLEVAHIWEHQIGNEDGATPALEAVLQIDAQHDEAFEQLEKLHAAAERHEQLVELYLARIETREEVGERTELLRRVAKVFEEKLQDPEQAYEALQTAFELDYGDEKTQSYLEKMAHAAKKWPQLIQLASGWLEAAQEPHKQIRFCLLLAKWYGEELDRQDYAQPYYVKVLSLDPRNVQVLRQMANFYKKNAQWQQQGQMLSKALEVATRDLDRAAIFADMGEVLEKRMDKADEGVTYYKRAIDVLPTQLPALEALERIYEARALSPELGDILEKKAASLEEPAAKAGTLLRLAALFESTLGEPDKAATAYRSVLELDAGSLSAMRGLERIYGAKRAWPELLEVLEMHLDVAATEKERIEVLLQIAHLQEEEFLKPELAAQRLEQVVEVDPGASGAFDALARCYAKMRQWLDLVGCYERHVAATGERAKKIELHTNIAQVFADHVEDQQRALDAYLSIVEIDPDHVPALDALAKLYERADDPANAIEYMSRVAERTVDGAQRVEAFYRIGRQLEEKLGDRGQARERFQQALDLSPAHLPSLAALRAIAVDEADWDLAARLLDSEQQYTEAPRTRAKLLVELGRLRAQMIGDQAGAIQAYEAAIAQDADNEDAALPLVRDYVENQRWPEAEPLADMLVRKAGKRERDEQLELYMLHGRVATALGKHDVALRSYQAAHKLDLTNHAAIAGLADANFQLGDWAGALTNYQKVLTGLGEEDVDRRAEIYFKLGSVKRAQGQVKQAINNFEKGLNLSPAHRPTLQALVEIYEGLNDWGQACVYRQAIVDNVLDGDERFALLSDLATAYSDRVGDAVKSLQAYECALDLRPDDHLLQHKMLQLYQQTQQWDRVVDILQRIAEADPKPDRRSRYLFTMAQVYRDKLDDPYHAAELFDEALDLNPEYLEAFERLDKIYSSQNDWNKLERAYRKMIHRIHGQNKTDLEFKLWHALGFVYRDRLADLAKASEAFKMAAALRPESAEEQLMLAQLAEQTGNLDEAFRCYRRLVMLDPMQFEPYRSIYTLCLQQQDYDGAWCVASVLSFLNRANEEEQRFFEDWRPQDIPKVRARLNNELWVKHLFHEDESLYIGKIFEAVARAALAAKIDSLKAKREQPVLPEQFLQDPQKSTASFARAFWWAAEVLGMAPPRLYCRGDVPGGLVAVAADPPSSIAGQGVLAGLSSLEQAFVAAKHLTMYRGEHYIKTLCPTVTELTVLLFSAICIIAPDTPTPPDIVAQVKGTAQSLARYLQPVQREQLKLVVGKFLKEKARANLKRWAQCVETTSARAGLLLCGDLNVAKKVVAAQGQLPGDLTPQERLRELMAFGVSDSYFKLRKALGIDIRPEAPAEGQPAQ